MVGDEFKDFDMDDVDEFLGDGDCPSCGQPGCKGGGQCPGGGMGQGGMPGQGQGPGGGKGQGQGGVMPERMTKTGTKNEFSPSKSGKGRILSEKWVYGVPEKGESRKNYSAEVRNAREEAMSSLARNPVPQEYKEMVRDYFSSLEPEKGKDE